MAMAAQGRELEGALWFLVSRPRTSGEVFLHPTGLLDERAFFHGSREHDLLLPSSSALSTTC